MKKLILITIFLPLCIYSNAQDHCSETINTVAGTTIDIFDWTQETYTFRLNNNNGNITKIVNSPFFGDNNILRFK